MFVIIGINRKRFPVGGINLANGRNIAPVTISSPVLAHCKGKGRRRSWLLLFSMMRMRGTITLSSGMLSESLLGAHAKALQQPRHLLGAIRSIRTSSAIMFFVATIAWTRSSRQLCVAEVGVGRGFEMRRKTGMQIRPMVLSAVRRRRRMRSRVR
jgi:hypothetical protein